MKVNITIKWFLLFIISALFFSCNKSSSNNSQPAPGSVSIVNMSFSPASITVKAGTTVTWKNNDNMAHTVTADDASFDSGALNNGQTFSHTFNTAATVTYHCTYHSTMTASVVVN
jgi:plastocyanin